MKRSRSTRLLSVALAVVTMGMSPYCYRQEFVEYQFALSGIPAEAFLLPDSVREGRFFLSLSDSSRSYRCEGFRAYDVLLHRSGSDDLGQNGLYVKLDRSAPARLHVVMYFDREHGRSPEDWAEKVAQLMLQGSSTEVKVPAVATADLGERETFRKWCGRWGTLADSVSSPPGRE